MIKIFYKFKNKVGDLLSSHYIVAKSATFPDYFSNKSLTLNIIHTKCLGKVYPMQFIGNEQPTSLEVPTPNTYIAHLKDAMIIGQSNIVLSSDNMLLHDILSDEKQSNINVTDPGLLLLFNKVIHFGLYYVVKFKKKKDVIDRGIYITGNFSNNYYHFLIEHVVKFLLISESKLDSSIPIIVDNCCMSIPQMREILSIFNLDNRDIVVLDSHDMYNVKELYIPSSINHTAPNRKRQDLGHNTDFSINSMSLEFLRKTVFSRCGISDRVPATELIYLSRKNATRRKCNDTEISEFLLKNGFKIVFPEELNFIQQVECFSKAKCIIAPTGAALTNLVFVNIKAHILVLVPNALDVPVFSNLVGALGNEILFVHPSSISQCQLHSNFNINIRYIQDFLEHINSNNND